MKDTWFYLPQEKHARLVALHGEDSLSHVYHITKPVEVSGSYFEPDYPNANGKMFSGGAGLASTAYDYAIFMQMILNGGTYNGKRILSRNSVKLMTENQINSLFVGDSKFSLAFSVATEKESVKIGMPEGTLGWGGAFSSSYWIDPANKIIAQLFINQWPNSHAEIHDKFKVQVYSALK